MNECIKEWMHKGMNGQNEQMDERMDGWIIEWRNEQVEWINWWMKE